MPARLAIAPSSHPAWTTHECLQAVEARCRSLIHPISTPTEANFGAAAKAADYHLQGGGRRIRARLAIDTSRCLNLSLNDAVTLASTCELLHNASLAHDDLQDRDPSRRGRAAVWKIYGDETAICTGDLLLSSAYAALALLDQPTHLPLLLPLIHARIAAAIQGQTADVAHRSQTVTDLATYLRIATYKSGALLSLPLELALIAAGRQEWARSAREAAEAFAIGYQIADDLEDLTQDASNPGGAVLNIALLLKAQASDADGQSDVLIWQRCVSLARQHLQLAQTAAASLPNQCGRFLAQLAHDLEQRL